MPMAMTHQFDPFDSTKINFVIARPFDSSIPQDLCIYGEVHRGTRSEAQARLDTMARVDPNMQWDIYEVLYRKIS